MSSTEPDLTITGTEPVDLENLAVGIVELAMSYGVRFPGPPEDFCDPLVRRLGLMLRDGVAYPTEEVRQPDGSYLTFRRLPSV